MITGDCLRSEAQVSQIAAARRGQTSAHFTGARLSLAKFFINAILGAQRLIAVKHAELISAAGRALTWARTAIMGVMQAAQALGTRIRMQINQTLESITASVQGRVLGIAGQITGLINSVPLPDIPGIGQIRAAAVNMLNRAAGVVNGAFSRFAGFIGWTLNAGMNLLDLLLTGFSRVVDMTLSLASSAILGVLDLIALALNRAVSRIVSSLQRALTGLIFPMLNILEGFINRLVSRAEKIAISLLRANRRRSLAALAEIVTPGTAAQRSEAPPTGNQTTGIRKIVQAALACNRLIVQTFVVLMGGLTTVIIRTIASIAARIFTVITGLIMQAIAKIAAAVIQAILMLNRLIQIIGSFLQELIRALTQAVITLVSTLLSLVQRGVERLIQFIMEALRRVAGFIGRFVQNLILGRGLSESLRDALGEFIISHGPITRPRPGPITIPVVLFGIVVMLALAGAAIALAFPELAFIVVWLVSLGLSPMAAFAVFGAIALAVLLLLLLLLVLFIRWVTKPSPPRPPVPVTIGGGTELWYFNGGTPTAYPIRRTLTAAAGGTPGVFRWSIPSGGLIADFDGSLTVVGPTANLRSKDASRASHDVHVRVDFAGAGGETGSASARYTVQAPASVRFIRNDDHTDPTFVYETKIHKAPVDQFGTDLPRGVEINEQFTATPTADFPGMDWRRGAHDGGFIVPPDWHYDTVEGETPDHTPTPVPPTDADAGIKVYHWPGIWRIGSSTVGSGREVERVTWQKYTGRARHI
jgi:hypothetical protein